MNNTWIVNIVNLTFAKTAMSILTRQCNAKNVKYKLKEHVILKYSHLSYAVSVKNNFAKK